MKTVTKWALAFAAAVAIVVLTACGISQAPASQPAAPADVQPVTSVPASGAPNGVAILTRAGVTGAYANGQDIYGDANSEGEVHSAGCTAADNCGEQFTIYTNADQATLNTNMAALLSSAAAPGGSDVIITGPRYVLEITGVDDPNATSGNGTVTTWPRPRWHSASAARSSTDHWPCREMTHHQPHRGRQPGPAVRGHQEVQ